MHKILIIEDQKILLDTLAAAVASDGSFTVAGKLADAALALEFLRGNAVDLILSDICTANGNNFLDCIAPIKKAYPGIKIVVMTGLPEVTFVNRAKAAGADSFIYKNISSAELLSLLKSALGGYQTFPAREKNGCGLDSLSKKELDVLRLICEGGGRKSIAEALGVSEVFVKNQISAVLQKTGFGSIAQLAIFAVSNGFIVPHAATNH